MDKSFPLLTAKDIGEMNEVPNRHQFNDNAIRHTRSLTDQLGLSDLGVHLVRVEPGHDSTQFHFHHQDEEFLYILEGTGIAELGDEQVRVAAGDFLAFAKHSLPHNLHNDSDADLVYLMGGTRSNIDICDYPRINRRMYREDGTKTFSDMDDLHDV
ncbi:MAG: cupin domain-containing protein [Pseudomonadales bacterium]|nr:cupin domain-containing protein [Pseudomonadales bacterium]MBO6563546.1 cupin domain-containing protein [Pseudomonadales bacterium]MBO6594335.1 cupin domain-containing protein [Pseudomonadales bacterium]MBO6657487.1 cupin domain-containing protein [Pseudomonadales bacterium]MBO6822104.1 cupin domain-containing protein [Pseudomonadales bacterium]